MARLPSVLFVCWGNVCRSPAAELILKREMKRRGFGDVKVKSAGVGADMKMNQPSWRMRWAVLCRGFWLSPKPRLFRRLDCENYDLVIAMDRQVLDSIRIMARGKPKNIRLLSSFLPGHWPVDVPDPMNRSVSTCNRVLDLLEAACDAICGNVIRQTVELASPSSKSTVPKLLSNEFPGQIGITP